MTIFSRHNWGGNHKQFLIRLLLMNSILYKIRFHYLVYALITTSNLAINGALTVYTARLDPHVIEVNATITLEKNDFLYRDYIDFSVDDPDVVISNWESSTEPTNHYDTKFKNTKKIFPSTVTFTIVAQQTNKDKKVNPRLRFSYYTHLKKRISEKIIPLKFHISTTASSSPAAPILMDSLMGAPTHLLPEPVYVGSISQFDKQKIFATQYWAAIIDWPYSSMICLIIIVALGLFLTAIALEARSFAPLTSHPLIYELNQVFIALVLAVFFSFTRAYMPVAAWLLTLIFCCIVSGLSQLYLSDRLASSPIQTAKRVVGVGLTSSACIAVFYLYKSLLLIK